jgi:hypothetical protein
MGRLMPIVDPEEIRSAARVRTPGTSELTIERSWTAKP